MVEMISIALKVDAQNMPCPMPLLKAKQGLNHINVGECVQVVVTDPASERDFKTFARLSEHELIKFDKNDTTLIYIFKKGEK